MLLQTSSTLNLVEQTCHLDSSNSLTRSYVIRLIIEICPNYRAIRKSDHEERFMRSGNNTFLR